jgi:hypothetical protein
LPAEATRLRIVALAAIAGAVVGVFVTWTSDGPVDLDGVQGPNTGWLVLILTALALVWTPSMTRGSWVGILGVLGASVVMGWTALENWLDNRDVFGASASLGLVLVLAASVALAAVAVASAARLVRRRRTQHAL